MQEIVGARFHCAQCENIDICQNCDAAGLPGNLDSPDGGHISSHIMIKVRIIIALHLGPGGSTCTRVDSPPHPDSGSPVHESDGNQAVDGQGRRARPGGQPERPCTTKLPRLRVLPHRTRVRRAGRRDHSRRRAWNRVRRVRTGASPYFARCASSPTPAFYVTAQPIVGVRYQCANCSSYPKSISLVCGFFLAQSSGPKTLIRILQCERCEARSYALHDPWHVFFKLPRPVDRPLVLQPPLPRL